MSPGAAAGPVPPQRRELRLTAAGRGLAAAVLVLVGISWSTGGAGALAAAAALTVLASAPLLAGAGTWGVRALAPRPTTAFRGEAFPFEIPLVNLSRRRTARDLVVTPGEGDGSLRGSGYLPALPRGAAAAVATVHRLHRRGLHRSHRVRVVSTFPFGLVACRLWFDLEADVLVLPRLGRYAGLERVAARRRGYRSHGEGARGDEQEFHGLREWREGESLRRVHWKLSARRQRLLVREFRGEDRPPVHVVLCPAVAGDPSTAARRRAFEDAVSLAATVCEHFLRREHPVRHTVLGPEPAGLDRRRGRRALFPILRTLAHVQPVARDGGAERAEEGLQGRRDEVTVLVRAGGLREEGSPAAAPPPGTHVLDVDDPAVRRAFARARPAGRGGLLGAVR